MIIIIIIIISFCTCVQGERLDLSARQGDVAGENYHNEEVNLTKCDIEAEIGERCSTHDTAKLKVRSRLG